MFIEKVYAVRTEIVEPAYSTYESVKEEVQNSIKNAARASKQTLKRFLSENTYKIPPIPNPMAEKAKEHYENAIRILRGDIEQDELDVDEIPVDVIRSAIAELDKAIELNPFYVGFFALRGSLHAFEMRLDEAMKDLDHAINLHPDFEDTHFPKGTMYVQRAILKGMITIRNLFGSSIEDLEQAAAMGHVEAKRALEIMAYLAKAPLGIVLERREIDEDDFTS
jgi:tetratricopeptide (TPR) repeat protein